MGPYYVAAREVGSKRWERAGRDGNYICIANRILTSLFFDSEDDAKRISDGINATGRFEAEVRRNRKWSSGQ